MEPHKRRVDGGHVQQVAEEYVERGGQKEDDRGHAIVVDQQLGNDSVGRHQESGDTLAGHHRLGVLFGQHGGESVEARLLHGAPDGGQGHGGHVHQVGGVGGEHVPGHLADGHEDQRGEGYHVAEEHSRLERSHRQHYVVHQHGGEGHEDVRHRHVQGNRTTRKTSLPVVRRNDKTVR